MKIIATVLPEKRLIESESNRKLSKVE